MNDFTGVAIRIPLVGSAQNPPCTGGRLIIFPTGKREIPSVALSPPLVGSFEMKNLPCSASVREHPEPPLLKGGGPPTGGSEGLCGSLLRIQKTKANSYCGSQSPSLGNAEPAPFNKGASGWCKFGDLYAALETHHVIVMKTPGGG